MASRRIPVSAAFIPPHFRDGTVVRGHIRDAHERRAPRVVDVQGGYVSGHWSSGYIRDGKYILGHYVPPHMRRDHRRSKPQ
jgi:hypothetical protein